MRVGICISCWGWFWGVESDILIFWLCILGWFFVEEVRKEEGSSWRWEVIVCGVKRSS